jgi:hypothetical protein
MLSADMTFTMLADQAATLRLDNDGYNDYVQIVNNDNTVLASQLLSDTSSVEVLGSEGQDDNLTVDNSIVEILGETFSVTFDGDSLTEGEPDTTDNDILQFIPHDYVTGVTDTLVTLNNGGNISITNVEKVLDESPNTIVAELEYFSNLMDYLSAGSAEIDTSLFSTEIPFVTISFDDLVSEKPVQILQRLFDEELTTIDPESSTNPEVDLRDLITNDPMLEDTILEYFSLRNLTIGDVLNASDVFTENVLDAVDSTGASLRTIKNYSELESVLSNLGFTCQIDPAGQIVTITLNDLHQNFTGQTIPLTFDYDLGALSLQTDSEVTVGGSLEMDLVLQFDLDSDTLYMQDNSQIMGDITLTGTGLSASGQYGLVGVSASDGTIQMTTDPADSNTLDIVFADPAITADSALDGDNKISMLEFYKALYTGKASNDNIDLVDIIQSGTVNGTASVQFDELTVDPATNVDGLAPGTDPVPTIKLSKDISDSTEYAVELNDSSAILADFSVLTAQDVIDALVAIEDGFVASLPDYELPFIGTKMGDLLGYKSAFAAAVAGLNMDSMTNLNTLEEHIETVFGLTDEQLSLIYIPDTATEAAVLKFSMDYNKSTSDVQDFDISTQIGEAGDTYQELYGDVMLDYEASSELDLVFGIDLTTPSEVYIYDESGVVLSTKVDQTGLNFNAFIDSALVLAVTGGSIKILDSADEAVEFTVDLPDAADQRYTLAELAALTLTGVMEDGSKVEANLPTDALTIIVEDDLASGVHTVTPTDLQTLLANAESAKGLNDDLGRVYEGLDSFLVQLESIMAGAEILGISDWPIIGEQLSNAIKFIDDIQTAINDTALKIAALPEAISDALTNIFGPDGVDWLVGNVIYTNPDNDGDPDTSDTYQWELDLAKTLLEFDIGQLEFTFGSSLLDLDIAADISFELGWDWNLVFGLNVNDGFYFDISNSSDFGLNIQANATGSAGANALGIFNLEVTPIESELANLFAEFAIDLTDNGDDLVYLNDGFSGLTADRTLTASADLDLHLKASIDAGSYSSFFP